MSQSYIGQIRMFSFNFPPKNWAFCNGQTLAIQQNQALFSILGTTYGGNGVTTFALPNLQSRTPIHSGGSSQHPLGEIGGAASITLGINEIPQHTHTANANSGAPNQGSPTGNNWAQGPYSGSATSSMNPTSTGGGQPHENRPPFTVINFSICLAGLFPSRN